MSDNNFFISDLSSYSYTSNECHIPKSHGKKRKTKIGIIEKGTGTCFYLDKKLSVSEGDIIFLPGKIYSYSGWHGTPEIEVKYVNFLMNCSSDIYDFEPQLLTPDDTIRDDLLEIHNLLSGSSLDSLDAYAILYRLLKKIFLILSHSEVNIDKTLQTAISYITTNWNSNFSAKDIAKECCISESKLYHLFKSQLNQSPLHYLNSIKINKAIFYLENSNYSITTISQLVCFNSENHFRKIFADFTGTTPSKYRKKLAYL